MLLGGVVAAVFALAFVSARRFGPLALSLAAGSVLAELWASTLSVVIGGMGLVVPGLPSVVLATVIVTLLPLLVLLGGGPRYQGKYERILSSAAIALLTAALLVRPLGASMVVAGESFVIHQLISGWWQYVVTAGLLLGIADIFLLHTVPAAAKTSKAKH